MLGNQIKRHDTLVVCGPQTAEKDSGNGEERDVLNVGVVFGVICDHYQESAGSNSIPELTMMNVVIL